MLDDAEQQFLYFLLLVAGKVSSTKTKYIYSKSHLCRDAKSHLCRDSKSCVSGVDNGYAFRLETQDFASLQSSSRLIL